MSSGFVTETEIAEARKRRQEEWEKVRRPDQPKERPEEAYDSRSLFDQLREQKMKKDLEYDEAHKLKNLIRGLNDDEVQFLEMVDQTKMDLEKKQMLEEEKELKEFRNRVATLQEQAIDKKLLSELKPKIKTPTTSARPSQKSLLAVGIKRKNGEIKPNTAVDGSDEYGTTSAECKQTKLEIPQNDKKEKLPVAEEDNTTKTLKCIKTNEFDKGHFKCVAILPGLGPYTESSDSEISSDSDDEPCTNREPFKYDLVGRQHLKKKQCESD